MSKRVACLRCRDSKKRCDRTQPCSRCRDWAKANHVNAELICEYRQPPGARDQDVIPCLAERMLGSGVHSSKENSPVDKQACMNALVQDGWTLNDKIESGGNGHVFIGVHPHKTETLQGRYAVVKVGARSRAKQLHDELSALLFCIGLPHVVQLVFKPGTSLGLLELGGCGLGLVMEHVRKLGLAEAAANSDWPDKGPRCISTLFVAVAGMHSRGLIHGDISTSNVIIREEDAAVTLIDLGMAQSFKTGLFFYGTRGFRAPEFKGADSSQPLQAALVNEHAAAADLWAAGATALCFAAGLPLLVAEPDKKLTPHDQKKKQDEYLHTEAATACSAREKASWTRELAARFAANPIPKAAVYECCSALLHHEAARRTSAARIAAVLAKALEASPETPS